MPHAVAVYTCGTMMSPWRMELVSAVDQVIKQRVMTNWPTVPDDWSRPRSEMDRLRGYVRFLHPMPSPDRADWNGTGHHGDPRFYVPRDLMLIDRCDLLVSYIGQEDKSLGGAGEVGYAYARGRRIITVDTNPLNQNYDFWRGMSVSIFTDVNQAAEFLMFLIADELHVPYTASVPMKQEDGHEVLSR